MQTHTKQVQEELIQLKQSYRVQSEHFIADVKSLDDSLIKTSNQLNLTCSQLNDLTKQHTYELNIHTSEINALKQRCTFVEIDNKELRQITATLEIQKVNKSQFLNTRKKQDLKGLEHDIKLFKNQNHCGTLDNYLEKYLPIHV